MLLYIVLGYLKDCIFKLLQQAVPIYKVFDGCISNDNFHAKTKKPYQVQQPYHGKGSGSRCRHNWDHPWLWELN